MAKKIIAIAAVVTLIGIVGWVVLPHYLANNTKVSEAQYLSVVKPGLKVDSLKRTFGEPMAEREGPNGSVVYSYLAPAPKIQDIGQTNEFGGFEVVVKDDAVVSSYITNRTIYRQQ